MQDLFSVPANGGDAAEWLALDMVDADVRYLPWFDWGMPAAECLDRLKAEVPWRQDPIEVWGKTYDQPRLSAWFGDAGCAYTYSGLQLSPLPWTPLLQHIKQRVEAACGQTFNSVLLNHYRNERDSMGAHSDDEPELGPQPTIASVSFGVTRKLIFSHRSRSDVRNVHVPLESGSLLLMRGATQSHWKHAINKQKTPLAARINLTFRVIYPRNATGGRH